MVLSIHTLFSSTDSFVWNSWGIKILVFKSYLSITFIKRLSFFNTAWYSLQFAAAYCAYTGHWYEYLMIAADIQNEGWPIHLYLFNKKNITCIILFVSRLFQWSTWKCSSDRSDGLVMWSFLGANVGQTFWESFGQNHWGYLGQTLVFISD